MPLNSGVRRATVIASIVVGLGVIAVASTGRPPDPLPARPVSLGPSRARPRVVLDVQRGVFDPAIESALLSGLLAGSRASAVELLEESQVDAATRSLRACSREDPAYEACRARHLDLAGRLKVNLQFGPIPGVWQLSPVFHRTDGTARWLPTVPFALDNEAGFAATVERAAHELGRSLTPDGHALPPTSIVGSPVDPARLCSTLLSDAAFSSWETGNALRAHLHRVGKDRSTPEALGALKRAIPVPGERCEQLRALLDFQRRAIDRDWLSRSVTPEAWKANIDVLLAGPEARSPSAPLVADIVAGAFAIRGVTARYVGELAERCDEHTEECASPYRLPPLNARLWSVLVEGVRWQSGRLEVRLTLFRPGPDGVPVAMAIPAPPIEPSSAAASRALDQAVARALDAR